MKPVNIVIVVALLLIAAVCINGQRAMDRAEAEFKVQLEQSEARAQAHEQTAAELLCRVQERDAEEQRLARLSLDLANRIDSITDRYHAFTPRLRSAGRNELHALADSIRAAHDLNRNRYLVLLDTRSPGVD